jgi:DNA modification methylase
MIKLINGDCLELMKEIDDDSIDLIFCDLPYGATACKWDCCINLDLFWIEVMRIKKLNTPIFFTTTTKFGVSLITSAPKKCHFRYDLIWCKSAPVGHLNAKRAPMRKHEMIYVFYEKLPFYDLSSHQHKFLKEVPNEEYDKREKKERNTIKKGENYGKEYLDKKVNYRKYDPTLGGKGAPSHIYEPPLPTTMLEIKSTRGKHSTEKPVALMEWILKYYSKEGDVILDPTMGSGNSGIACKNMNRKFIGIEKDEEIFKIAEDNLKIIP